MGNFWQDNNFLVTGGAGFLGHEVVGLLRLRGAEHIFVPRQVEYDLRSIHDIHRVLRDSHPSVIIHLAAHVGGIGANREKPGEFFYDNLMMGVQLLHEARLAGVEKFVTIGTVCAYPKYTPVPFREDDLWDGYPEETNAPYGIAKKALLVQGQAYREQYGFNSIYLLPTNLYGPGDNFDPASSHVIPALIRRAVEAKERGDRQLVVWGTGMASRDFLYVADAAEGILRAAERYNSADPLNLGSGHEVTIRELVGWIVEAVGYEGDIVWDHSKPDGQPRRALDSRRAEKLLGWKPNIDFREGLRFTVNYYLEYQRAREVV